MPYSSIEASIALRLYDGIAHQRHPAIKMVRLLNGTRSRLLYPHLYRENETEATLPISHEALELCGEWGKGLVFKGLTRAMTHHPLKKWIADAGIKKKITFHCFRHSYAVIQISLGTDIYTVSKMLTHKNVTTTQIYADLVNSKKRETANKISLK